MSHEEQSDLFQIRREKVSALREKGSGILSPQV